MVVAVYTGPVSVRNRAEEGTNEANDVVYLSLFQEGVMATIMLDNEDANEEESVDCAKAQREPNGIVNTEIHGDPEGNKRAKAAEQLADGSASTCLLVLSYDRLPVLEALIDVFLVFADGILHLK